MKWLCSIIFICHLVFLGTFTEYPNNRRELDGIKYVITIYLTVVYQIDI